MKFMSIFNENDSFMLNENDMKEYYLNYTRAIWFGWLMTLII